MAMTWSDMSRALSQQWFWHMATVDPLEAALMARRSIKHALARVHYSLLTVTVDVLPLIPCPAQDLSECTS